MEILSFFVSETKYCIDIKNIQEIVLLTNKITNINRNDKYREGVTLVRNDTVEVINIYKLLNLINKEEEDKSFLIILKKKEGDSIPKGFKVHKLGSVINTENLKKQEIQFKTSEFIDEVFIEETEDGNELMVLLNDKVIRDV